MLRLMSANRSPSFAAATSIAATGVLLLAATAHAQPLQTPCRDFKFGLGYELVESTGYRVTFSPGSVDFDYFYETGNHVTAYDSSGLTRNVGGVANAILDGRNLYLDVHWRNGWGTEYSGEVNDDGAVVNGTKRDWIRYEEHFHTWKSTIVRVVCEDVPGKKADDQLINEVPLPR